MRYQVDMTGRFSVSVEVEAEDGEQAYDRALGVAGGRRLIEIEELKVDGHHIRPLTPKGEEP